MADEIGRVVVADNNVEIVIAMYAHGQAVSTTIKPLRALELARRLIEAALPKLENGGEEGK